MCQYIKTSKSLLLSLALGLLSISLNSSASVSDTMDDITADATFTYTGGDGRKLSQIGRHAYTFGRIRFTNPTDTVNLVNLTPPNISAPNCSSININLGSFDVISMDEAVAILRRIASEALTYGFGLALQSMCSPCWTAMKTLQTQLERLNLANRNTCTMVKSFINEKTEDGDVFDLRRYVCQGESDTTGSDPYSCGLENSALAKTVASTWESFVTTVESKGGDPQAKFLYGNVVAESFSKMQGVTAIPDAIFPSEISELILGAPAVDPVTDPTHSGISVTEAAMNLFGYYYVGPNDDEGEISSGYVDPPVETLEKLLDGKLNDCDGANCRKLLQCADYEVTSQESGTTYKLSCSGGSTTQPNYAAAVTAYVNDNQCTAKVSEVSLTEVVRCIVEGAYRKVESGDTANLTTLQQKIIQASPTEVIRVISIGEPKDKGTLFKLMGDNLGEYLTYSMIYNYVTDLAQATNLLLNQGKKELGIGGNQVSQIFEEIDRKLEQAEKIKKKSDEALANLEQSEMYANLIKAYSKSLSRQVTSNLNQQK